MATIGKHLSNLKSLLANYSRTPESFTDEFLYNLLKGARGEIIKNKLKQGNIVNDSNWFRFCIKLDLVTAHNCDCTDDVDCKVLRTKYKIPSVFTSRNSSKIQVSLFNGTAISIVPLNKWNLLKSQSPCDYLASFLDGYIYFWNLPTNLKIVEIYGLFLDPLELLEVKGCNPLGDSEFDCFTMDTVDFPMEEEYQNAAYQMVLKMLNITLSVPQDTTNDSNARQ